MFKIHIFVCIVGLLGELNIVKAITTEIKQIVWWHSFFYLNPPPSCQVNVQGKMISADAFAIILSWTTYLPNYP